MSFRLIVKNSAVFLLILLWVYAALSKLLDFRHFTWEMRNQELPDVIQTMLIYLLPPVELIIAGLLTIPRLVLVALRASAILLVLFSGYIALTLMHFFEYVPCSCGGILEHMSWGAHLFFNLFFLLMTLTALYITKKERSTGAAI